MTWNDITPFDHIVALFLLLFLIRGVWIGFVRQLAATAALFGSYWLAARYIDQIMPYAEAYVDQPGLVFLVSFAVLFTASTSLFLLIGKLLHDRAEVSLLGWFNRLAGGLLGLARGAAVIVLLHMILLLFLTPSHGLFQDSLTAPWLEKGAEIIRKLIHDAKVRDDLKPEQNVRHKKPQPDTDRAKDKEGEEGAGARQVEVTRPGLPGSRPGSAASCRPASSGPA